MEPSKFGDSYDMTKRQIMQWLAPDEQWSAHPMWYNQRREPEWGRPFTFLERYAAALNVHIVAGESQNRTQFREAAQGCRTHLLLDPDTGISDDADNEHVTYNEIRRIVQAQNRRASLTLVYDQGHQTVIDRPHLLARIGYKLERLHDANVHAVAYIAHSPNVTFIWASEDPQAVTQATRRMQRESHFPICRFVDDGCGHMG